MYNTYFTWEELAMMIRSEWAERALHKLLKIAGVDGSPQEVRGSRTEITAVLVRRPKKPPSRLARRSQNQNPACEGIAERSKGNRLLWGVHPGKSLAPQASKAAHFLDQVRVLDAFATMNEAA